MTAFAATSPKLAGHPIGASGRGDARATKASDQTSAVGQTEIAATTGTTAPATTKASGGVGGAEGGIVSQAVRHANASQSGHLKGLLGYLIGGRK